MNKPQRFDHAASIDWLRDLAEQGLELDIEREKLRIRSADFSPEQGFEFRLPWSFPVWRPEEDLEDYLDRVEPWPQPYFMILIQAGHSALGYFEEGELVFHKVIKKYMVRRKRGKAQIGYLNSRGKSKAGSRIRLANTVSFFEDINGKLEEWAVADQVQRILMSLPIRMQPLFYGSKVKPPFEKGDPRIRKIPLDTGRPDLAELERVNQIGSYGYLTGSMA